MLLVTTPQQGASLLSTEDFIIELCCRIDDVMGDVPKHRQANLYPSEVVTLGLVFAIKGVGGRAFYRWVQRDWLPLFPRLPDRPRLFRLFAVHHAWTTRVLADPTVLGVADPDGIEWLHPMREGRSDTQIGKKGTSNHRWIVGGKLAFVLNQFGLVVAWTCDTATVSEATFHPLITQFADTMIILTESGFHAKGGDPSTMKICPRRTWNVRMVVETVLSMLTTVCHIKNVAHRVWKYVQARLAFILAAFNVLAQWHGFQPDEHGFVHLSIAEFSL